MAPRPRSVARAAARFVAYLAAAWGTLLVLAWGAVPRAPWLGPALVALAAAYVTFPVAAFLARGGGWRRYPTASFRLFVVRPALYAQLLLPVGAGAGAVGLLLGAPFGHALATGRAASAAAFLAAGVVLAAGWLGSRRLVVREVEARVPGLPDAFDGLRIVQVSDLHVGPQTSQAFLGRVARSVGALRPDLVVATGDLVDDRVEDARIFAAWLHTLPDTPLGTHLIPGNHDVYAGWSGVAATLRRESDAHLLVNDARVLHRDGASIALLGTGDPAAGRSRGEGAAPDLGRAFARVPVETPVVAFAHNPALWPALADRGAALTLSGHTHWGQLALPRLGWSLASPFLEHAMGAYQQGEALLYVHPGTGFWGIPFRLGAFPEVAAITLRRAESAGISMGAARRAA
ncbi:metallophosphoesterase [Roseisolibacter sp. H3M3-2]|uniref:metallophosphoesterase n=1 Tax=Roseisolibacter sp. H3M3-2 TaxID=3031323 RepID=UPI0023DB1A61|nr:metallophosphoesterase [Roseisolibacter sp. H3M3-2]MDF1504137.1 metallophosphoesterase [Roseisolibacter sp. H3M3-2]